jgi:hypothetical protein
MRSLCLCTLLLLSLAGVAAAAEHASAGLTFLRVDLPDGKTWTLGQRGIGRPFMAVLLLSNEGQTPIKLWDHKNSEGAQSPGVILTDAKGQETILRPAPIARAAGFPTVETLQPHGVIGIELELLRLIGQRGLPPGAYKLKGIYENKLKNETDFIKGEVWTGRIESAPVEIAIVAPKLAAARSAAAPVTNTTVGQIEALQGNDLTLHVFRGHSGIMSAMKTDDQTVVLIDGRQSKLTDLKRGQWVKVTRDADWKKVLQIEPSVAPW